MSMRIRPLVRCALFFALVFIAFGTLFTSQIIQSSTITAKLSLRYYANLIFKMADNHDPSKNKPACLIPIIENQPMPIFQDINPPINANCSSYPKNPVFIRDGSIHVQFDAKNRSRISCDYVNVKMLDDFNVAFLTNESSNPLPNGRSLCPNTESGVFKVICRENAVSRNKKRRKIVFQSLMRCILPKHQVIERVKNAHFVEKSQTRFNERLNIIMFGLDSVSSSVWRDQMQETARFMAQHLSGVTFERYNIVGDGTTAALLGITTGHFEHELPESRRGFASATHVDDFPFIWNKLRDEAGYVTLWHEDQASSAAFNYRLQGFEKPPVDHYGRIFQLALEKEYPKDYCLGSLSVYEEMLTLYRQLFRAYPDPVRKFALIFSGDFTHTSAGIANSNQAFRIIDPITVRELEYLKTKNLLNNSALILFSDHGSRYGPLRDTEYGKLFERLPYLSIALPTWFRKKYPDEMRNFKAASKQLTTPFDLHATLLDLAGIKAKRRGISFFDPIPPSRTCEDAGILPHWCTCLSSSETMPVLTLNDSLVAKCLYEFTRFVNENLLKPVFNECEPIEVDNVFQAKRLSFRREFLQFKANGAIDSHGRTPGFNTEQEGQLLRNNVEFVEIFFQTQPGNARWEVTFEHRLDAKTITVNQKQISRTNRYGSSPRCVEKRFPNLRQFCHCRLPK